MCFFIRLNKIASHICRMPMAMCLRDRKGNGAAEDIFIRLTRGLDAVPKYTTDH